MTTYLLKLSIVLQMALGAVIPKEAQMYVYSLINKPVTTSHDK